MIRINLITAQKQVPEFSGETLENEFTSGGFLSKLFAKSAREVNASNDIGGGKSSEVKAILNLIIILSIPVGLFTYQEINIPKLNSMLAAENSKLLEVTNYNLKSESLVAEIKKHKENKALIEKQIASLDGLSRVRSKYVKALDLIQQNIPEKMWFVELKSNGDNLLARGISYSETEISDFLARVGKSVYFSDVSLISSEDSKDKPNDRVNFKKFQINFNLEVAQ